MMTARVLRGTAVGSGAGRIDGIGEEAPSEKGGMRTAPATADRTAAGSVADWARRVASGRLRGRHDVRPTVGNGVGLLVGSSTGAGSARWSAPGSGRWRGLRGRAGN